VLQQGGGPRKGGERGLGTNPSSAIASAHHHPIATNALGKINWVVDLTRYDCEVVVILLQVAPPTTTTTSPLTSPPNRWLTNPF
jgi:hypothetical protein